MHDTVEVAERLVDSGRSSDGETGAFVFCAALFLLLAITKFRSGSWLMYAWTLAFGLGALGCFKAARQYFANDPLDSMRG